ncbi:hypothetical protein [Methylovirgula sp. HY1]|uniref:hypothetical protein n=1 Tax=Methylovirgula sp. HY1 TaxID=2822761 RepID=UPI001C5A62F8|nr:hypothetical protein [Methylovirgula sp. HY1]QXX74741.1 hypothetical protein MHY1_01557 [Methylovirgula sp. HY1]
MKRKADRLETAKERLRRMENLIQPYTDDLAPQGSLDRGKWLPGEYIDRKHESDDCDLKMTNSA